MPGADEHFRRPRSVAAVHLSSHLHVYRRPDSLRVHTCPWMTTKTLTKLITPKILLLDPGWQLSVALPRVTVCTTRLGATRPFLDEKHGLELLSHYKENAIFFLNLTRRGMDGEPCFSEIAFH